MSKKDFREWAREKGLCDSKIVAGGECEKKLYKVNRKLLEEREKAVKETLDSIFAKVLELEVKHIKSFACRGAGCGYCLALSDVRDVINKYREPAKSAIYGGTADENNPIHLVSRDTTDFLRIPVRMKFPASEIDWQDDRGAREFTEYQKRKRCVCPHPGQLCNDCYTDAK